MTKMFQELCILDSQDSTNKCNQHIKYITNYHIFQNQQKSIKNQYHQNYINPISTDIIKYFLVFMSLQTYKYSKI